MFVFLANAVLLFVVFGLVYFFLVQEKEQTGDYVPPRNIAVSSTIVSIVSSVLLFIFAVFIFYQFRYSLFALPEAFSDVSMLVKSGFWQLFCVSLLSM